MNVPKMIFILYQLEDLKVNNKLVEARELVKRELEKLEKIEESN